jgi:hypothetical protein
MDMPIAEVVDRYTILTMRRQKQPGRLRAFDAQWEACRKVIDDKQLDPDALFRINGQMWEVEERISTETDLATIGILYLALRWLSSKRIEEKNRIAEQHGEPVEKKTY